MAGPYFCMALEQAPNAEGQTNKVATERFFYVAESIADDDGFVPLDEQNMVNAGLGRSPHKGAAEYSPAIKLVKVHPRPNNLGQLFYGVCGSCVSTPGDGDEVLDPDAVEVPIGATRHVPSFKTTEPPQTLQANGATGDARYRKGTGLAIAELAFAYDNGALACDVDLIGLWLDDIPDPSIVPVRDESYPLRRGDMTVTWLAGSAKTNDFDFKIANPVEAVKQVLVRSLYPDLAQFKNDDLPLISGTIAKASVDDTDLEAMKDGAQFPAVIKIEGREEIGSTGYYPTLWIEMPGCQLVKGTRDPIKAERRRETKYEWEAREDALGVTAVITLVNAQAAYDTYPA